MALNANIIAIINKLKNQKKQADIDIIHKQLVKTNSIQYLTKEDLLKKVHDLETEGKIDSFHVSKHMVKAFAKNILENTQIRFHDSSFDTPTINQTHSQSLSNSSSRKSQNSSIHDFDIIANTQTVLTRKTLGRKNH